MTGRILVFEVLKLYHRTPFAVRDAQNDSIWKVIFSWKGPVAI